MPMTATPVFTQTPDLEIATLTSPTPITSRANITGTTGLVALASTATNGKRVDSIIVKSKGTSLAGTLFIWVYNGTTSFLLDEIDLTAVTPSNTLASMSVTKNYSGLNLKATTESLYISVTVAQDLNVFTSTGAY